MYQGSLNFIIYFYFPILKELIVYVGYCFISINDILLVVKCYSSLVVSGFSRNEFNTIFSLGEEYRSFSSSSYNVKTPGILTFG